MNLAREFYTAAFRPGESHVWNARDLHAASDGSTYFIGECFETGLNAGPTPSVWRLAAGGDKELIAAGAHLLAVAPDGTAGLCLARSEEAGEQLRLLSLPGGGTLEERPIFGRVEEVSWSPDGRRALLLVAGAEADVSGREGGFALRAGEVQESWRPETHRSEGGDAWRRLLLWAPGADPSELTAPPVNVWEASWLGNDRLLVVASDHHGEGSWYRADLRVIDADRGVELGRYAGQEQLGVPAGSPAGQRHAVVEAVCSDRGIVCGDVSLFDQIGGAPRRLDLGGVQVTYLVWRDDSRLLFAGLSEDATVVGEYDAGTGRCETLWTSGALTIGGWYPRATPAGDRAALAVLESYGRPPFIARLEGGNAMPLLDLAPPGDFAVAGTMEPVRWKGRDGLEIGGWLIRPDGDQRNLPLLVDMHGGPIYAVRNRFAAAFRAAPVLASLGCAVLLPNPRGSGGRGQDYARRVVGDMGGEDAHDLLCGIDALVERGLVDGERVAIFGTSYGGYMSATMIAHHRRFAAAIPMSPVANWYSQHYASQIPWFDQAFLGGSPREPGGPYFDRSPVFFLEGAITPSLVIAGARDRNTPTSQAVELFQGLVEAGCPAELVVYPEDGHSLRGYPAYVDTAERIAAWLVQHLRLEPAGS